MKRRSRATADAMAPGWWLIELSGQVDPKIDEHACKSSDREDAVYDRPVNARRLRSHQPDAYFGPSSYLRAAEPPKSAAFALHLGPRLIESIGEAAAIGSIDIGAALVAREAAPTSFIGLGESDVAGARLTFRTRGGSASLRFTSNFGATVLTETSWGSWTSAPLPAEQKSAQMALSSARCLLPRWSKSVTGN
jgi:hypothetical protein